MSLDVLAIRNGKSIVPEVLMLAQSNQLACLSKLILDCESACRGFIGFFDACHTIVGSLSLDEGQKVSKEDAFELQKLDEIVSALLEEHQLLREDNKRDDLKNFVDNFSANCDRLRQSRT